MNCQGWIGYCQNLNCENENPVGTLQPVGTIEETVYNAVDLYFVFYSLIDCYEGGYQDENSILKTETKEFIDDNFPFVDGYIPKQADIRETIYIPRAEYIHEFNPDYIIHDDIIVFSSFLSNGWVGYCQFQNCEGENMIYQG